MRTTRDQQHQFRPVDASGSSAASTRGRRGSSRGQHSNSDAVVSCLARKVLRRSSSVTVNPAGCGFESHGAHITAGQSPDQSRAVRRSTALVTSLAVCPHPRRRLRQGRTTRNTLMGKDGQQWVDRRASGKPERPRRQVGGSGLGWFSALVGVALARPGTGTGRPHGSWIGLRRVMRRAARVCGRGPSCPARDGRSRPSHRPHVRCPMPGIPGRPRW